MAVKSSTTRKYRTQRRLNTDLPGLGKTGALERRPYGPGQHGSNRKKPSEYGLRLLEKQKLRAHYQLQERSLQRFVRDSHRAGLNWISELSRRLELRLDNLVFRGQFAPSIMAARQLVRHGHVLLNGKKVDIGSVVAKVGDTLTIKEKSKEHTLVLQCQSSPRLDLPAFLEKPDALTIKVISDPKTEDIPFNYNERLIAEYYATRGRK